jgi:hypothetical protein
MGACDSEQEPRAERLFIAREKLKAAAWGVAATALLAILIVAGSRNLAHFDGALVGYTFATLFALFGITYRYAMWLQRPPTAMYFRRGWQMFLDRRYLSRMFREWGKRLVAMFAFNSFIWRRNRCRWAAHFLIMWGCVVAAAIIIRFRSSSGGSALRPKRAISPTIAFMCSASRPFDSPWTDSSATSSFTASSGPLSS